MSFFILMMSAYNLYLTNTHQINMSKVVCLQVLITRTWNLISLRERCPGGVSSYLYVDMYIQPEAIGQGGTVKTAQPGS